MPRIPFQLKDTIHRIYVKFVPAYLPTAKKPYNAKAVRQVELGIEEIAAKAGIYKIDAEPSVIEMGLTRGMELMYYLLADGFRLKTPLMDLKLSIPGQYIGNETQLPPEVYPRARVRINPTLRKYLKDNVKIEFDGVDDNEGIIAETFDEATGSVNELMTRGNFLVIKGRGLKLESDDEHTGETGVFFIPETGAPVKASLVAWNAPKLLKVIVPPELDEDTDYHVSLATWSSPKGGSFILKKPREIRSDFTLMAAPA